MIASERLYLRRLLITLAIVALAIFLWSVIDLLLLIFAAVLVAAILRSIAEPVCRWTRLPPRVALVVAIVLLFAVIALAGWLFGAEIAAQTRMLTQTVPEAWAELERRMGETVLGNRLEGWIDEAKPAGSSILAGASQFLLSFGNAILGIFLVLIGGIYFAAQPGLYREGLLKLVPATQRKLLGNALDDSSRALRLWLLGQLISMIVIGVLTGIGLVLIGVPSAFALGLLAGIAAFVPLIGPVLAAIPALLVALTEGTTVALLTLGLYVVVQQIEGDILMPMIQQRIVALPPALTLFAILAAGIVFGPLGVLLAAPLTVVVFVMVKRLYVREALDTPTPIPGET